MKKIVLAVALVLLLATGVFAQKSEGIAKMNSILPRSNYSFVATKNPSVWVALVPNSFGGKYKVITAVGDDDYSYGSQLVTFVTLTPKATLPDSLELYKKLARLSHDYDRVKISLDSDDDLSIRIDSTVRILDVQEFNVVVKQIVAACDSIMKEIQPQLVR